MFLRRFEKKLPPSLLRRRISRRAITRLEMFTFLQDSRRSRGSVAPIETLGTKPEEVCHLRKTLDNIATMSL
ncbi:hypothetical protein CEXT_109281 [Caerostris extrusa]|uniref:Uncharacterized protein n=1 Tax=Caerostris extrusa TaxID=172846 RepID=A0AAV4UHL2_CAEEX|nr:hypothetical protein CEXT_109281 [Caerostris extrusa]